MAEMRGTHLSLSELTAGGGEVGRFSYWEHTEQTQLRAKTGHPCVSGVSPFSPAQLTGTLYRRVGAGLGGRGLRAGVCLSIQNRTVGGAVGEARSCLVSVPCSFSSPFYFFQFLKKLM